jgi:EamA domain-containing membrane protein RarD
LIGWKIYHEPFTIERVISFSLIWIAIALYAFSSRNKQLAVSSPEN